MAKIKMFDLLMEIEADYASMGQPKQLQQNTESSDNCAKEALALLELQTQLKMFHWQTKGVAQHDAFGKIYDSLGEIIDSFIEKYMGAYGRFTLEEGSPNIQILNHSDSNVEAYSATAIELFKGMRDKVSDHSDLVNILDEAIGEINQLKYLLTLS
jgi:DNA-binding ferritin-like protein